MVATVDFDSSEEALAERGWTVCCILFLYVLGIRKVALFDGFAVFRSNTGAGTSDADLGNTGMYGREEAGVDETTESGSGGLEAVGGVSGAITITSCFFGSSFSGDSSESVSGSMGGFTVELLAEFLILSASLVIMLDISRFKAIVFTTLLC